ncbi:MAG: transcriptional repressor [Bacteroidota bacterium]
MGITRKTKSVKRLLQLFEQTNNAISVVELVKRLDQEMSKTTVYRILDRLEDEGILHFFIGKDGLKWFAKCRGESSPSLPLNSHPHFQCQNCGKTECLFIDISIPPIANFTIEAAEILLIGLCEDCLS